MRRLLLAADVAGLLLAFFAAQAIYESSTPFDRVGPNTETLLFLATLPGWIFVGKLYGLYDRDDIRPNHTTVDDFVDIVHLVTMGSWLFLAAAWLTRAAHPAFSKLLTFWVFAIGAIVLGRALARSLGRSRPAYVQNAIIVGAGDVGQLVARKLLQHPEYGINLVGFVDADPKERSAKLEHLALLGAPDRLSELVPLLNVERVIVAFSGDSHVDTTDLVRSLKDFQVQVDIVPRLFDLLSPNAAIHAVEGVPLVGLPPLNLTRSSRLLKRAMDVCLAAVALVCLAPVFAYIAWRIKSESPGPVVFKQIRMGAGGRQFEIYKFRTMVVGADEQKDTVAHLNLHDTDGGDPRMFKIEHDPRTTRFGRMLRRYSLDELPQLINVLRGEMSLVGPRPLILEEDRHVDDWARKRLDLKPGMTGLWQVLGRSHIPFDEMVKLDYLYVTSWSLWKDVLLLGRTLPAVLRSGNGSY